MAKRDRRVDEFELAEVSMRAGPAAAAARARELLAEGRLPDDTTRVELLAELTDYLLMSDDLEGAETTVREAIADGGRAFADLRILLAEIRARRGDRPQADELLRQVWSSRPSGAADYRTAAELLEEWGDHAGALKWINTGAFRTMRLDERITRDQLDLLVVRRRMRLEMGFTEDEYDVVAADEVQARYDALYEDGEFS